MMGEETTTAVVLIDVKDSQGISWTDPAYDPWGD